MVRISPAKWLWLASLLGASCTPEATEVDAPNAGGQSAGGSSGACGMLESPRSNCADCLHHECGAELLACADTDCLCGGFGAYRGQINCLLACPTISPERTQECAQSCGFAGLEAADPTTQALFRCLIAPPGPPACRACFGPRP